MSVITIYSGLFCNDAAVIRNIVETGGYHLVTDDRVIGQASELSGIDENILKKAFTSRTSIFNPFTHEKERSIAVLKLSLAQFLDRENIIVSGDAGHLIPASVHHVLRVCLIATTEFRLEQAEKESRFSEKDAAQIIQIHDHDRSLWTDQLFCVKNPWDPSLYDIVLSMDKTTPTMAWELIKETISKKNISEDAVQMTDVSRASRDDFLLAATAEAALLKAGHCVGVEAANGRILLTINKKVLMLNRLEDELKSIAESISGVKSVETCVKMVDIPPSVYKKQNSELPSKVLLVDDEKEFVQTLSERLQIRDMGSAVVYDGESALNLIREDEPEVMIIDLKMPGIDGMDVLKQVKQSHPEIEVIVLTGHGSEQDRIKCMTLGAFAYMQKPVDINLLSQALKKAHEKVTAHE